MGDEWRVIGAWPMWITDDEQNYSVKFQRFGLQTVGGSTYTK
jgi:hypothetical protein